MKDNEGKDTDIFGFVSGEPVEFNIVQIGKAFMFDLKNTEKKASNEGVGANLLSDFQFRTLPVSDDSWKYILSQTETNFNNVKNLMEGIGQKIYNETKMLLYNKDTTLENLQEVGCDGAENINLADFAQQNWKYSSSKNLSCSTVDPHGAGSCNFGEESKCDFLTRDSTVPGILQCLTGVQHRFGCYNFRVKDTNGTLTDTFSLNPDADYWNPFNLIKISYEYLGTPYIHLRDLVNIWTQPTCDLQSSCAAKSYQRPKDGACDNIFNFDDPGGYVDCSSETGPDIGCPVPGAPRFAEGMRCFGAGDWGDGGGCNYNPGFYPNWNTYVTSPWKCFLRYEDKEPAVGDFLYLDNTFNALADGYALSDTYDEYSSNGDNNFFFDEHPKDGGDYRCETQPGRLPDATYNRLSARARSRKNFNCVGQPYTNGIQFYPAEPTPIRCTGGDEERCPPEGQLTTPESTIKSKILGQAYGCEGRFADTGTFGPIVGRVDKESFLKFVSMDNLLKKWSNFNIMLAPPTYCHPDSDELAMIHLLAKYGEFNASGIQSLMTFMGAPHSGALKGYYDITSIIYGASCDYPFNKVMPGSNITMDKCCVHAYTNNITCTKDLQQTISDSVPGISTIRDPDPSKADVTLLPWQELSCPLEVTIDDDRSPSMSLKQQFDSISVSASKLVADQTGTMDALGRGCYMCVTPSVNSLFETLNTKTNWLDHYDPVACATTSIVPTMEFVPKSNSGTNGPFNNRDVEIDSTKRFRPSRQYPTTRDEIAGVYTLYPYIDIPAQLPEDQINDTIIQNNYQKLLSLQLKYYHDVDYHIKVEVTGTFA